MKSANIHIVLLMLILIPCVLVFVTILGLVMVTLNKSHGSLRQHPHNVLLDATLVRRHVRSITFILLLAPMDIELMALLPWTSSDYGGFPSRRVLLSFVICALVQKSSLIFLGVYFITLE